MPDPESTQPQIVDEHGLPIRELRRADQLRALAHPRRLQIMDLLIEKGPLTASECAVELSDSAGSCSYHLRQLARFGFVTEADGARGRNRPWRWVGVGTRIKAGDTAEDRSAADALTAVIDAGKLDRIRRHLERQATDPWRGSASSTAWSIRMTESELLDLGSAINALLAPLQRRTFDGEALAGSRMVDVFAYLMPRPDEQEAASGEVTDPGPMTGQGHGQPRA